MTGTTPRRRHSPAVYRRRRLVLLGGLVLVVAVIVWLVVAPPWRGQASTSSPPETDAVDVAATELPAVTDGSEAATGETPAAETPEPAASGTPTAKACDAGDIVVEAVTDADTYGAGQNPGLSITLTNNGPACSLNVGTTTQVFAITSGADTWWRSTDCQSEPSDMIVLLAAGQTVSSATPVTWDRTRSEVGSCADANRPAAPAGGASYHLSVSIGGIGSTQSKQFLLY
ncbi:hypothetical protein [Microbacterium sp.]|uniref:hypothetical protein n=1 Tax=Microbacterium sp. TaxID=51671 RepID=UPI003F70A626